MHLHFKPSWHIHKPGNLGLLEMSHSLRTFGVNLIALFIPIYLLQLGYSLDQVFFHAALKYLSAVVFIIPAIWIYSKININWAITLNIPINLLFLYLLFQNPSSINDLILLSIVTGIATQIYWLGFYLEFNHDTVDSKIGKEVSVMRMFIELSKTLSPLVGGLILGYFSFGLLFFVSSVILTISGIPMVLHTPNKAKLNLKKTIQSIKNVPRKYKFTMAAHGFDEASSLVLWPLFVYLFIIESFVGLGAITTFSFLLVLVVMLFAGKLFDLKKSTLKLGSLTASLIWLLKVLAETVSHAIGLNLFQGLSNELLLIPYHAKLNREAKKEHDPVTFFIINEAILNGTKFLIFIFIILIPVYKFESIFILTALTSLFFYRL